MNNFSYESTLSLRTEILSLAQENSSGEINAEIVLKETCFYPAGGGQLSDVGEIFGPGWTVQVTKVCRDNDSSTIRHLGIFLPNQADVPASSESKDIFAKGTEVQLEVNLKIRELHSRLHSAGHLLDIALLDKLGYGDILRVLKACHHPKMAAVEYEGLLPIITGNSETSRQNKSLLKDNLEKACNELIKRNLKIKVYYSGENLHNCREKLRCWKLEEHQREINCGGTHCASTGEIGSMRIRKIECKGKIIRIAYDVDR
ncbi:Threonyl/alanyl tRNA synthetase SAD [Perkinsela sp. CCAP 1560/4]|nr:Threonyl/alanyl tRNA synthetase SAD [Perkinsela sp. CCAP 1560/4]|eukprot:KNH07518.1 Threonyl/alanyl tRNA synthetase SAD [Perkinsela sp. CCAP 1560/4]